MTTELHPEAPAEATDASQTQAGPPTETDRELTSRDSPPIVWLARLGAFFVLVQIYVYGRWIFSDEFASTPTGPDKIPDSTMFWIRTWEAVSIVGGVLLVAWMIRKTRRDGAFPTLGVLVTAWLLASWQDPGVNYIRPVFAYNSGWFDRGTWAEFIPGWVNHAGTNPQPIFYWLATYVFFMPLSVLGIDKLIKRVRRVAPRINKAGIAGLLLVTFTILDLLIEQLFQRMGLWAYLRVNHDWSFFTGTMNQFPVYEGIAFGGIISVLSMVIYIFRNQQDHMITDAGIDRLRSKRSVGLVRVLALTALFNVAMLVFNMGFNMVNQHADTTPPKIPSYFSNGMCGLEPNPPCPPPTSR